MTTDQRLAAFCSRQGLDIFHSVIHQNEIWHPDPYDVKTIHKTARLAYERLINRLRRDVISDNSGRILLLLGESGAGKTHLMRVFRHQTHEQQTGFFSYMQMTSTVSNYARYVLRNTIDSFEKPYYELLEPTTGLVKLSNALAEDSETMTVDELERLREDNLSREELADLIYPIADRIVSLERFKDVDIDLIRALLYLQPEQPAVRAKIFKLLRCEPLTPYDSKMLGGMSSRDQEDDPLRMLRSLAALIQAVTQGAFVICIDQLEDVYTVEEAGQQFQRIIQTMVTLAEIPNVVVVLSFLDDFYSRLKSNLWQAHIDRLELDPAPVTLRAPRTADEVESIISRRLEHLYDLANVSLDERDHSVYPFSPEFVGKLSGLPTRRVIEMCRQQRDNSIISGQPPSEDGEDEITDPSLSELSQLWSGHLTETFEVPENDRYLLSLCGNSIERCGQELGNGYQFSTKVHNNFLTVDLSQAPELPGKSLLLSMCQKSAKGGALAKQIRELKEKANGQTPVALRTTEFPNNPSTKIAEQIAQFVTDGGRRAQVADSDWRTMMAIQSFEQQYGNHPDYAAWLRAEQPLSQLPSLQRILGLKNLPANGRTGNGVTPQPPGTTIEPKPPSVPPKKKTEVTPNGNDRPALEPKRPDPASEILLGQTGTAASTPVTISPQDLVRHAAFLGGSGSGKTTLALTLIEQLLLRGIPAILLDRKGDLCSYANPTAWEKSDDNPERAAYRQLLRDQLDVAVYTPGTIGNQGRPLSIPVTPAGLDQLPSAERQLIANYCASALAGVMGYKSSGLDKTRMAILGQAIAVLSTLQGEQPLSIGQLIKFIDEQDPLLIDAIGVLDPKYCKKLAEDLQTMSLTAGHFFDTQHEPLSTEQLLHSTQSGKTRLSVINLGSLGDNSNILFWVSQFLLDLNRYARNHPSGKLQAVVLFDEADLYLPAIGKPSTKEPMESLLKRARSAGLGILLATQSPGDMDYKSRDQISSWFVGKVKETTALNKLKPMLSEAKVDVTSKLANQQVGEFFAIRAGEVTSLQAQMSLIRAEQVPIERIQALAAGSVG